MNVLFTSPLGEHLVFKEATSLSKAYGFRADARAPFAFCAAFRTDEWW
jgi:hypothetical protein